MNVFRKHTPYLLIVLAAVNLLVWGYLAKVLI